MSGVFTKYEKSERVATITLNRPEARNAIGTHQDCRDFVDALQRAQDDATVSCIVLTGAGTAFSAGGNLKAMKDRLGLGPLSTPDETCANYRRGVQAISRALWDCEVPMIAAINGPAVGLGLDLACFCDIRLCSDNALFAASFIKVGLVPGDGGAWILPRAIGSSRAAELIFTGDTIDAAAALLMGLVGAVVPPSLLMPRVHDLAARIASNPPKALRLAKRLLREGQQQRLSDVLELSAAFQALAHETEDHHEALDALLEKRSPQFTGR